MKNNQYFILMADIINSRFRDQTDLAAAFRKLTARVNKNHREKMLSPVTVTLGDEFQCVISDLSNTVELVFSIEDEIFDQSADVKLRYVISEGTISSGINTEIGWGMMGEGLTHTRDVLNSMKKSKMRFFIDDRIRNSGIINSAFFLYESIIDDWDIQRDYPVIAAYNKSGDHDYKKVAGILRKNPDQIWKREKSLKIQEYYAAKEIIRYLCRGVKDA
jgi:hypothetical protein